jgi:hypothetical protein
MTQQLRRPLADLVADLGPISPELCLIDPELAAAARALLPGPILGPWEIEEELTLGKPIPEVLSPGMKPPSRRRSRARAIPRVLAIAATLAALVVVVPSAAVHGAIPARVLSKPSDKAAVGTTADGKPVLVVPDVCRLVYVFAKSMLQDAGFAWRVQGQVGGYAANRVLRQSPSPGTLVVDTGAPTVTLELAPNPGFPERGSPDQQAPYPGTTVQVWSPAGEVPAHSSGVLNGCERN